MPLPDDSCCPKKLRTACGVLARLEIDETGIRHFGGQQTRQRNQSHFRPLRLGKLVLDNTTLPSTISIWSHAVEPY